MNILLTGATGFLGHRTLEKLVEDERIHAVIATGRTLLPERHLQHSKIKYILGDLQNAVFVEKLMSNIDCVINTASLSSPWGREEEFVNANVLTQQNLINSAIKNNVTKFVYISSPSVYFTGKDRFNIKESDPLPTKFINEYARTKREAEKLLEKSGLSFVILRPRALIGRGDTIIMPRLIRAFDENKLKIIGNAKNLVDLTPVANVVDAIILSVFSSKESENQIYNISNGLPVYLWTKIDEVLRALGKNPKNKSVPASLAYTLAYLLELKSKLTNYHEPALTRYSIGTISQSFNLDITKAKELLKYEPIMTTDDAMYEFINWYKQQ